MRALINAFIIHITLNVLVFLKGWHSFENKKHLRILLILVFGIELLVYAFGLIFYRRIPENITQIIRVMGSSWMLFLLYSGGLWLIIDLIYILIRKIQKKSWSLKKQSQKFKIPSFTITILIVSIIMIYGHYSFLNPVVQQLQITVNKPVENIDSLRIAVIGDLHLGWMINRKHAKRFVDLIMAQEADLIFFVGDIIDSNIDPILQQNMGKELERLSASLGVFSCVGNHEYRYDAEEKIQLLNDVGITMLRDSAVFIDNAFYIVGREDKIIEDRKSTDKLLKDQNVNMSKPIIVLNHTPNDLSEESKAGVDIALYGHTHHGQVFPGNIATEIIYEVAHGYKKKDNTHVYVTSGIGLVGPQYRIGTVSEMVMLTVFFE